MINTLPSERARKDIVGQMDRILRDLGNPEPPFCTEDALHLLKLDRKYYSSVDEGFLMEVIHKIKVSGKQILDRPSLIIDVIKKAELKALWLPDSKQILIDQSLHRLKHRWTEGHEIAHSSIPWHRQFCLGDPAQTLRINCQEQIENEANYGSGHLLFLGGRFKEEASAFPCTIESIMTLRKIYGNTITSTLYRFVEQAHDHLPMFGVVCNQWFDESKEFDPLNPCEHLIVSEKFRSQFSDFNQHMAFDLMKGYCQHKRIGPLGSAKVTILDDNGKAHFFSMESHANHWQVLTLAVYQGPVEPFFIG